MTEQDEEKARADRASLFAHMEAVLRASGVEIDEAMRRDFAPLIDGEMTPDEHREFLIRKYGA